MPRSLAISLGVLCLVFSGACVATASGGVYYHTPLAPVGNGTTSIGLGCNFIDGSPVAVGFSKLANADQCPVEWNSAGVGTSLLPLISGAYAGQPNQADFIDSAGDICGDTLNSGGATVGFYVSGAGAGQLIPTLGGSGPSVATGVNPLGMVVGSSLTTDGSVHAYVWSAATGTVDLTNGSAFGAAGASATAISANGNTIVGYTTLSGGGFLQACTWTKSGSNWTMATICPQSLYDQSSAWAINSSGDIVGSCFNYPSTGFPSTDQEALYWPHGGGIYNLGDTGSTSAYGRGINDSGVIVGQDNLLTGWIDYNGAAGPLTVIDTSLLAPGQGAGWTLQAAYAIDNNGDIATRSKNASGAYEGSLLIPVLAGDANYDRKVDINDLTVVLAHYGQNGTTWSQGDFNNDGTVDINDLTIVLAHYGQRVGASAAGLAAVPEPSCMVLLAIGAGGLVAFAWQRRAGCRDAQ